MTSSENSSANSSSLNKRDQCDVAIVGGGPAGSMAAIHLARAGFKVVLFERESRQVEKVCGEFLSAECLPLLREVGLDPKVLGGVEIAGFRLHGPMQTVSLPFPRRAIGLSRSVLDDELLRLAAESGADIRRGVSANEILEGLDETTGSILLSTSVGETRAQRLIVATGKSEFSSLNERQGRDHGYAAFKMQVRLKPSCAARLAGHCDLFAFEQGYGGLTDLGGGIADLCFLIEKSALKKIRTDSDAMISLIGNSNWAASHDLDGAETLAASFSSIANLPNGFLRRAPAPAGLFFVGDQMAVIPSITGDGVTIALMTARRAVEAMIERVPDASAFAGDVVTGQFGAVRLRFAPLASRDYQKSIRGALRTQLDAALTVQSLFKNPRLVDASTYALRAFPSIFRRIYQTTRCHLFEPSATPRLRSWQKQASPVEIAPLQ
jgi:flavin-dependent dehydrogenase